MICRIFLFTVIAVIFKNNPKVCGNTVAIFKSDKNCHKNGIQKAIKTHVINLK